MKKVSIIIPIYNTEEFLHDCLSSVSNQTYPNMEVLLINDGSTDDSSQIIEEVCKKDSRFISFHLNEQKGVGYARNLGLQHATGDYIYFLDSDDFILENTIELLVENIGEYPMLTGKIKKITVKEELEFGEHRVKLIKDKNNSALHCLISIDFIRNHQLRFSEEVSCYSDWTFVFPIFLELTKIPYLTNCFYYKRLRNDPISNPSLMQMDKEEKMKDFLLIFNSLKDHYRENERANKFLDKLFLNFYRRRIVLILTSQKMIDQYFDQIVESFKLVNPDSYRKINFHVKLELNALKNEDKNRFAQYLKFHQYSRSLKNAFKSKRKLMLFIYRNIFKRLPFKEKTIVFESFLGKNYADSPKNIYEYMVDQNMDYNYVWIFNEKKEIPGNAKQVKRFSVQYYYYMATAKYWVSNSRLPLNLGKREGNIYLQTWHGTPLKKLVFDMNDIHSANPKYKKHFYLQSRRWDYLISANEYSTEIFRRAFKFDEEMLEFGYPRNDVLHSENRDELAREIKQKLNIPLDKKVILYAPTWRDDEFYEPGKYKFNLKLDLQKMKERLGSEYVILLRMHYFIADNIETTGAEDFAYNLSKYNDIADLYLISDILITDYSSVFFDYSNLKRPILFYTYDLEKYRDTLRGFYIDMEKDVPGPLLKTSDEVIEAIENIDTVSENYKETYERFYQLICGWEKGNATEQVVKRVFGE